MGKRCIVFTDFLSHPADYASNKPIKLLDHLKKVADAAQLLASESKFNVANHAYVAGLFHDLGKLGPYYQELFHKKQLKETLVQRYNSFHAPYSRWIADKILKNSNFNKQARRKILMVIYCHHIAMTNCPGQYDGQVNEKNHLTKSELISNWVKFKETISHDSGFSNFDLDIDLKYDDNIKGGKGISASNNPLYEFLEIGFLFSCLLQADKGSFSNNVIKKYDLYFDTEQLVKDDSILGHYRKEFQNHVMNTIDPKNNITIINAPTGIGKTKAFFDLIKKFKIDRVFYFSPLLALTDDIENKIKHMKANIEDVLSYNHIYSGSLDKKGMIDEAQSSTWNFDHEAFREKFTVTTTHRLLMTIYSNKNNDKLKFASLRNALLVVDEVQTLPKFLLKNLCEMLNILSENLGTKTLLVSATIPYELANFPKIQMKNESKYISERNRQIKETRFEPSQITSNGKNLVMVNTRKNAVEKFNEINKIHERVYYMSSGIRKKDREKILNEVKESNYALLVSTQVIEAGVDMSFSNIWRQLAPLDNMVQMLGRLDRENIDPNATLYFFEEENNSPYNSLEYKTSKKYLKNIKNTIQLYEQLPIYYKEISEKNQTQEDDQYTLARYISELDFERVWEHVKKSLGDDYHDTVYIPDFQNWEIVKQDLMSGKKSKIKKHALLLASLPKRKKDMPNLFDEELLDKNILFPKKDKIGELYDQKMGLDKWLNT